MNKLLLLPLLALPLLAAAPPQQRGFALAVPSILDPLAPFGSGMPAPRSNSPYTPAPLPNRDVSAPIPRASNDPRVAPSLFTRPNQYRGDGFTEDSTAQASEEKNNKPSAGFSLHIPMTGQ